MKKTILIAGDVMLDTYIFGKVGRISPEAPVPVLLEDETRMRFVPGGAANVAVNVKAAGQDASLFSLVGSDENGRRLLDRLEQEGIDNNAVLQLSDRPTTSKLRYIGQTNQQILRVDRESTEEVDIGSLNEKWRYLEDAAGNISLIVLSDYNKGFLSEAVCQRLITFANERCIRVLVDVKGSDAAKYKGAFLLKPNRSELSDLTGLRTDTIDDCVNASIVLREKADVEMVLATLGADGMILIDSQGLKKRVETVAKDVYDVTGAGDTSIAYLAAGLADGMSIEEAVDRANTAAGIQVSKMGTSLVYPDEVERAMNSSDGLMTKRLNYYTNDGLKSFFRNREGKRVVFTNGCFDILHAGHVTYLQKARELGDMLVVGLNSDASIKRLKGQDRPINNVEDRLKLLSALECVDYVVVFEEDTPINLIEKIRPEVLVKGGDYEIETIVGYEFLKSYGGITTTIPLVEGLSTTGLIDKMTKKQ